MSQPISPADIESLCGRPLAFVRVVRGLLKRRPSGSASGPPAAPTEGDAGRGVVSLRFARGARVDVDAAAREVWWLWPWDPDEDQPWARCRPEELALQRGDRTFDPYGEVNNPKGELHVALARSPRRGQRWADELASWLVDRGARPGLRVLLEGPEALAARASLGDPAGEGDNQSELGWLRAHRCLAARAPLPSASERALVDALDAGVATPQHWSVVADALQGRGDPLGESLAVALHDPTQRGYSQREAERLRALPRPRRMLAFVDASGRDFDVVDLISEPLAPEERGRFRVQLWAERVGPFIVRLLASSDCDAWSGLGLPEPLLAAPELRYLSAPRLASVTPRWTDLSSRDLSGFDLSRLLPVNPSPLPPSQTAIEAKLRGCDLRQTNLTGWVLDGADLRGVISDLGTRPSGASFVGARVSSRLNRRLLSWNGGLFQQQRGRPADLRGVIVED